VKYKRNIIQQIKNKYGVEHLHFFRGSRKTEIYDSHMWVPGYIICSLDPDLPKKYKENEEMHVDARLTHHELEAVLKALAENSRYAKGHYPTMHMPVLLEPYNIEANDLISLKSAYLLTYLSGI